MKREDSSINTGSRIYTIEVVSDPISIGMFAFALLEFNFLVRETAHHLLLTTGTMDPRYRLRLSIGYPRVPFR